MSTENKENKDIELEEKANEVENPEAAAEASENQESAEAQESSEAKDEEKAAEAPKEPSLEEQIEELKKQALYKQAEFENFRKRTLKEKADLLKNGAESAMRDLLPVVDDLERALDAISKGGDIDSLKEGVDLIYNKFVKYLESQHVKAIDSTGKDFDTDVHEAVTMFPAPDPSMKGKVIDTTIKGYMINDKVLRHAKVVVGS